MWILRSQAEDEETQGGGRSQFPLTGIFFCKIALSPALRLAFVERKCPMKCARARSHDGPFNGLTKIFGLAIPQ